MCKYVKTWLSQQCLNLFDRYPLNHSTLTMKSKNIKIVLIVSAIILTIPLIAMQLTTEVDWTTMDFVIAAMLLVGSGLIISLIIEKVQNSTQRIVAIIGIVLLLILTWAEMAVGIFGTPLAGS